MRETLTMQKQLLHYAAKTDTGIRRDHNEDTIGVLEHEGLWLVADGMGGHGSGEVASRVAKEQLMQAIGTGTGLAEAIQQAHSAVVNAVQAGQGAANMGTTVVALRTVGDNYQIAWVGDSRAYVWDGRLRQLTKDHSVQQELIDRSGGNPDDLPPGARSKAITRCIGPPNRGFPRVDLLQGVWESNQKVLLCSDGLSDELTDKEIARFITAHQGQGDQAIVEALVDAACHAGGRDNISVVLISSPRRGKWSATLRRLRDLLGRPAVMLALGVLCAGLAAWLAISILS